MTTIFIEDGEALLATWPNGITLYVEEHGAAWWNRDESRVWWVPLARA